MRCARMRGVIDMHCQLNSAARNGHCDACSCGLIGWIARRAMNKGFIGTGIDRSRGKKEHGPEFVSCAHALNDQKQW
jgi:hypothetical protein